MKLQADEFESLILEKFSQGSGKGHYKMLKGKDMELWLNKDKSGIQNSNFNLTCDFESLYAVYEKAVELGGKIYLGATAAQAGKRIGSDDFSVDTIDAFVAINFYGGRIGDKCTRRSTYYAAILDWAGIATNYWGGYMVIKPKYN